MTPERLKKIKGMAVEGDSVSSVIVIELAEYAEWLKLHVSELEKKLASIEMASCKECAGSGEIGLADGEVPCPTCGGSGDPLKPDIWAKESKIEKRK